MNVPVLRGEQLYIPFIGLIFLCQATGTPASFTNESKDSKWVDLEDVRTIIYDTPQKFYTVFLAPLKQYLLSRGNP